MTTITERRADEFAPGAGRDFGQELRRLRGRAGLTLRSLATRVAFDYSYLAQVERGTRAGSAKLAQRCDEALDANGQLVRLFFLTAVARLTEGQA